MLCISRPSARRSLPDSNLPAGKHETQVPLSRGPGQAPPGERKAMNPVSAARAEGMDGAPARSSARAGERAEA